MNVIRFLILVEALTAGVLVGAAAVLIRAVR